MDEAVIKRLEEVIKGLRQVRKDVWGQATIRTLRIDMEIKALEDLISDLDTNWNGCHPVGET